MIHHTKPAEAAIHETGWAEVPGTGVEVTRLPLIDLKHSLEDGTPLFARLSYSEALAVAAREGATLLAPRRINDLRRPGVAVQLTPYLGTPTAETDIMHSERHDADVWRQLRALSWDGRQPVVGAGKCWVAGAPADWSRLEGWDRDGAGPGLALWQPDSVAHRGRQHFDDGTTTVLERCVGGHRDAKPDTRPTLRLGTVGEAVRVWQRVLNADGHSVAVDGIFGPLTARDTGTYQGERGLPVTGVVDAATWAASLVPAAPDTLPAPPPSAAVAAVGGLTVAPSAPELTPAGHPEATGIVTVPCDLAAVPFRQARYYAPGLPTGPMLGICLHTAEIAESLRGAESLQASCATWDRLASWHFSVDADSVAQSVRIGDRAFAATMAAARLIHVELSGRSGQGAAGWADDYSLSTLGRAAGLVRELVRLIGCPVVRRGAEDWLAMRPGIYDHYAITQALQLARARGMRVEPWWDSGRQRWRHTDHQDVGPTFDWAAFLAAVRDA